MSPAPHLAVAGNEQNSVLPHSAPVMPPQVLPGMLPVPAWLLEPAVPLGQSAAVGQSSPTTPELLQPLAASENGASARMGSSQPQCAALLVRRCWFCLSDFIAAFLL